MNEIEMAKEAIRTSIVMRYTIFYDVLSKRIEDKPIAVGDLYTCKTAEGLAISYKGQPLPHPKEIEDLDIEAEPFSLVIDALIEAEDNHMDYWKGMC